MLALATSFRLIRASAVLVAVGTIFAGCALAESVSSPETPSPFPVKGDPNPLPPSQSVPVYEKTDVDTIPWRDAPDVNSKAERKWAIFTSCRDSGEDKDTVRFQTRVTRSEGQIVHQYRCIPPPDYYVPIPDQELVNKWIGESHREIPVAELTEAQSERYTIMLVDGEPVMIEHLEEKEGPLDDSKDQPASEDQPDNPEDRED